MQPSPEHASGVTQEGEGGGQGRGWRYLIGVTGVRVDAQLCMPRARLKRNPDETQAHWEMDRWGAGQRGSPQSSGLSEQEGGGSYFLPPGVWAHQTPNRGRTW